MPHIPQDKSDKTRESSTYWRLKELPIGDKAPLKPHISRSGGGGGGVGVYFDWCIIEAGYWKVKTVIWLFSRGWGHLNSFSAGEGGIWTKIFQEFKCPGVGGMLKLRFDWYIKLVYGRCRHYNIAKPGISV